MIRKPAVAGQFYPARPEELKKLIANLQKGAPQTEKHKAIACILPHAGYIYSGKVAAKVLSSIDIGDTCVILGPNHTGDGPPYSIMTEGEWQTPLGNVSINTALGTELLKTCKYLSEDALAHIDEHSIEVQLPLIQEVSKKDFTFVPIALASPDERVLKALADAIARAIRTLKINATIIASSDMTHYEPQENANKKDEEAIKAILKLDERLLMEKVEELNISMCGYIPAVVAIKAAKQLGAKFASLVSYQTSGDTTGDYTSVVGYAGITIT